MTTTMAKAPQKKPTKLTVGQAKRLGLAADRRRLEQEAIIRDAEDEAARELGRKQAEEKAATKAAAAAKRKADRIRDKGLRTKDVKDPVTKSEVYTANVGGQVTAKQRINRLRELIEPETEAMVKVMIDIAKDVTVHPSIRMECADKVLSRAYGKPKEHVEISDPGDAAASQDEVMTLLGNIFQAVGLPTMLPAPDPENSGAR